jgi:hypothetical protein
MRKERYTFLLLLLWSFQTQAIDLNSTNEIINKATEKSRKIEIEINTIIKENQTTPQEMLPIIETNQTKIEIVPVVIEEPLVEENQTTTQETLPLIETNQTKIEVVPVAIEVPLVEENQTIITVPQTENNQTTQEHNTTLNKETFDMSRGDTDKGKEIYINHFKDICEVKATKFAGEFEQEEWEALAEEGKLEITIFEICPKSKAIYNKEWSADLYQFLYENASDSEHIPEC